MADLKQSSSKTAPKPYDPMQEVTKKVVSSLGEFRASQAVEAAQAGKTDEEIISTLMQLAGTTYQKPTGDTAGFLGPLFGYKPGQAITQPEQIGLTNAIALSKFPGDMQRQPLEMQKLQGDIAQQPLQQKKLEQEVDPEFRASQAKREAQAKGSFLSAQDVFSKFEQATQPFVVQRDAYSRIKESGKNPSPAGDLAMIYGYMKMLDPGSTVREGEFATAQNSASIPERIRGLYNKVVSGKRLANEQRQDFLNRSKNIYSAAEAQYGKTRKEFTKLAIANQLDPEALIRDLGIIEGTSQTAEVTPNKNNDILARLKLDPNKYEVVENG